VLVPVRCRFPFGADSCLVLARVWCWFLPGAGSRLVLVPAWCWLVFGAGSCLVLARVRCWFLPGAGSRSVLAPARCPFLRHKVPPLAALCSAPTNEAGGQGRVVGAGDRAQGWVQSKVMESGFGAVGFGRCRCRRPRSGMGAEQSHGERVRGGGLRSLLVLGSRSGMGAEQIPGMGVEEAGRGPSARV
jgi:hypothetical protein